MIVRPSLLTWFMQAQCNFRLVILPQSWTDINSCRGRSPLSSGQSRERIGLKPQALVRLRGWLVSWWWEDDISDALIGLRECRTSITPDKRPAFNFMPRAAVCCWIYLICVLYFLIFGPDCQKSSTHQVTNSQDSEQEKYTTTRHYRHNLNVNLDQISKTKYK
jgi:hypothetical protein